MRHPPPWRIVRPSEDGHWHQLFYYGPKAEQEAKDAFAGLRHPNKMLHVFDRETGIWKVPS